MCGSLTGAVASRVGPNEAQRLPRADRVDARRGEPVRGLVGCGSDSGSTTPAANLLPARATGGRASVEIGQSVTPSATAVYQGASQLVDDLAIAGVRSTPYTPNTWGVRR